MTATEHQRCPCCGQDVPEGSPLPIIWSVLSGKERAFAAALAESSGDWVLTEDLIKRLYGRQPSEAERNCIGVFACNSRKKLLPFGLIVRGRIGGHKLGGYRLERALQ
jgi:DNA-binding response OmpR family regulator